MNKRAKEKYDQKTIKKYEQQLRNRRKEYAQYAQSYSSTGRRMRAAAVGECVLQLMDQLRQLAKEKRLIEGSLFWTINEQKVKDTDNKKGFHYLVCWHVKSDEDFYTEEEIRKELEETYRKIRQETDEMFAEEPAEEQPG